MPDHVAGEVGHHVHPHTGAGGQEQQHAPEHPRHGSSHRPGVAASAQGDQPPHVEPEQDHRGQTQHQVEAPQTEHRLEGERPRQLKTQQRLLPGGHIERCRGRGAAERDRQTQGARHDHRFDQSDAQQRAAVHRGVGRRSLDAVDDAPAHRQPEHRQQCQAQRFGHDQQPVGRRQQVRRVQTNQSVDDPGQPERDDRHRGHHRIAAQRERDPSPATHRVGNHRDETADVKRGSEQMDDQRVDGNVVGGAARGVARRGNRQEREHRDPQPDDRPAPAQGEPLTDPGGQCNDRGPAPRGRHLDLGDRHDPLVRRQGLPERAPGHIRQGQRDEQGRRDRPRDVDPRGDLLCAVAVHVEGLVFLRRGEERGEQRHSHRHRCQQLGDRADRREPGGGEQARVRDAEELECQVRGHSRERDHHTCRHDREQHHDRHHTAGTQRSGGGGSFGRGCLRRRRHDPYRRKRVSRGPIRACSAHPRDRRRFMRAVHLPADYRACSHAPTRPPLSRTPGLS